MESASILRRIEAYIIDIISFGVLFGFLLRLISLSGFSENHLHFLSLSSIFFFITITYLLDGQTFGKKLLKIKVVGLSGKLTLKAITVRYVAHYLFYSIPTLLVQMLVTMSLIEQVLIWSISIGYILVMVKDKENRALHDMVAGTKVVKSD